MSAPTTAVFLAPIFILFEIAQLVGAERLLGVKKIRAGVDPRQSGPGETLAAIWSLAIFAEAAWILWLATSPSTRVPAGCMLLVWLIGFSLRGNCGLRWVLVILTIEGALRLGFITAMLGSAWRAL